MDDPEGPTEAEAILVTGGCIGVAMAFLIQAQLSGTAAAASRRQRRGRCHVGGIEITDLEPVMNLAGLRDGK